MKLMARHLSECVVIIGSATTTRESDKATTDPNTDGLLPGAFYGKFLLDSARAYQL